MQIAAIAGAPCGWGGWMRAGQGRPAEEGKQRPVGLRLDAAAVTDAVDESVAPLGVRDLLVAPDATSGGRRHAGSR